MTNKSTRLLVIGLDGATFDLINPWVSEGRLPSLGKLLKKGAHGTLNTVPNMNSAPAWTSFATGKNPGKHGIYYFDERIPGTYNKRYLNGGFRQGKPFWQTLSDAGFQVGVINVPMTFPCEKINGFMLAGLDAPGVDSPGFCYPPQLIKELQHEVGDYIIEPGIPGFMQNDRRDLAVKRLFEAIEKRYAYIRYLLTNKPWDFFMVTFTATDAAHHFFWKDMDTAHPEHDAEEAKRYRDIILQTYQRLDQIIGELMSLAPDTDIMIMSDHGGGFNQRGAEYLSSWLAELGLLHYENSKETSKTSILRGRIKDRLIGLSHNIYHLLNRILDRETKLKLVRLLPGLRERIEASMVFKDIDWQRTKAYTFGIRDDIWINLAGREPEGIVQPGQEYDELCEFIVDKLHQTRDVLTHQPVVAQANRAEEIYSGSNLRKAPDITIRWRTEFVIRGLYIPEPGKPSPPVRPLSANLNNGGHRPNGILMFSGKHTPERATIQNANLIDLAPTILHYFGLPIPIEMDGKVLTSLFDEAYISRHPIHYASAAEQSDSAGTDYELDEQVTIEERLRGLGYVE